jgi:inositol phosphorylceramide mannosyltransferase catalytic subunit
LIQRCHRRLDPLRTYPLWLRRTDPTGISNDAMGSRRHHPYLRRVVDHLKIYGHTWILPYLTVMLSTGPLFLSAQWKEYLWTNPRGEDEINVLMPNWYSLLYRRGIDYRFEEDSTRFFSSFGGSSWHRSDVAFIFWVRNPVPLLFSKLTSSCRQKNTGSF